MTKTTTVQEIRHQLTEILVALHAIETTRNEHDRNAIVHASNAVHAARSALFECEDQS